MQQPNIIFMFMDNLGYGDIGCFGSTLHRTPNIDRLAEEGMRLTSYYSVSGVCTPSRAGLMTGCYPRRVNLHCSGRDSCVLQPIEPKGLHPDEITVARVLKDAGYRTACIGKWHLGDQLPFLPTRHGFAEYLGIPYSDNMEPRPGHEDWPPLPLMRGEEVIDAPVDRDFLTRRYTEEAVRFIRENRDNPFFLYMPHAFPGSCHEPFAHPDFRGKSANGIYGDCVEELDWSCGEMMKALAECGLEENTLVVWTSDNGAVRFDPPQGSNLPLSGWGYNTSEGAQRMPCVVRWPGHVPAGAESDEIVSTLDLLPTAAHLAGTREPEDRIIDGRDAMPILAGEPDAVSSYDERGFFYYHREQLQAVRSGPWKLYLPLDHKLRNLRSDYANATPSEAALFDVRNDIGETTEVSAEHPDVVARLMALADSARADLGDWDREGANQRPAGWVENPTPRVKA